MKPTRVAVFAALGMLLTSVTVYSFTPPGGVKISADDSTRAGLVAGGDTGDRALDSSALSNPSEFSAGTTLRVDGRLGHTKIAKDGRGETFVMLEVKGDPAKGTTRAPVNLALVIDRSGSMKGNRLRNAIQGAAAAIDRLNDGDVVSVITFDSRTQVLVPPTVIDASSRSRVRGDVQGITIGGDTCISCGIEDALRELDRTGGRVNRMVILSDGDATAGVRDIPGFRAMAQRARDRGTAITTIGVDVDYNEKIMTAIALDSNGRHYFVENESALSRVFEAEAESLTTTLASGAEAQIELAPGVELLRVFDRTFRRAGNRIVVPLGSFGGGDTKTVLLKVRAPTDREGQQAIADVEMTYRDLTTSTDGRCNGKLALDVATGAASPLDAVIEGRVNRSETASTLKEANDLFQQGRLADARRKLEERRQELATASATAAANAPAPRKTDVDRDFGTQVAAINDANQQFAAPSASASPFPGAPAAAPPAPDSRAGKAAMKQNASRATEMAF